MNLMRRRLRAFTWRNYCGNHRCTDHTRDNSCAAARRRNESLGGKLGINAGRRWKKAPQHALESGVAKTDSHSARRQIRQNARASLRIRPFTGAIHVPTIFEVTLLKLPARTIGGLSGEHFRSAVIPDQSQDRSEVCVMECSLACIMCSHISNARPS